MSLRDTTRLLRSAALSAPAPVYAAARRRHPTLVFLPTPADALSALDDARPETYPRRDAITQAFLAEHQRSRHSLWSSALVAAYAPMLVSLRRRLVSDTIPSDELDQIVLTAFLGAIAFQYRDRVAMRLRQRTRRDVFAALRKEHEQPLDPIDDHELAVEPHPPPKHLDLARLMNRAARKGIPRTGLDVVETTVLRKESLRNFVQRTGPANPADQERMYQRLKKRRSRALAQLRSLLEPSPSGMPSTLSPMESDDLESDDI